MSRDDETPEVPPPECREALRPHLETALRMDWSAPPPEVRDELARVDHAPYVETDQLEPVFDEPRRSRLAAALTLLRARLDLGDRLGWSLLRAAQARVLGEDSVGFRAGHAYARDGSERYGYFQGVEALFARRLPVRDHHRVHPVTAAVRAYLDVIFFHPFPDGNARAARLACHAVLRPLRITTPRWLALLGPRKTPGDAGTYWFFVRCAAADIVAAARERPEART